MSVTIHVPQPFNQARFRQSVEVKLDTPHARTKGGWLADLTDTHKAITLCPMHVGGFNPRQHGYELWRDLYVRAHCNACGEMDAHCRMFIHESTHDLVGDPRPRKGRWAS